MDDNEKMMKAHEEILQSLNMLHKEANKDSGSRQVASAIQVTTYISHSRKDYKENEN
jgi:hypothetical protein